VVLRQLVAPVDQRMAEKVAQGLLRGCSRQRDGRLLSRNRIETPELEQIRRLEMRDGDGDRD
jgi:hypothetical protein